MEQKFEMVAKTMKGLEEVLAEELRGLGAERVEPGRRMVSFYGDLEMLYRANLCCRTALCILKPFYSFTATDPDLLYEKVKEYDWSSIMSVDKTFCIDSVVNSEEFTHSRFVTYKVKDGIVDWFRDRYGENQRPSVRINDADILINVHISGTNVTLSLDSSGPSLHKRGYRVAQTEAPINEVLAAGIILMSGWRGETPFVDPMCGSGTFLIEAALIAANINPGIYRKGFAFENWPDFDAELFERLYNDDSGERDVKCRIVGADISPKAIDVATQNIKSAGVGQYIDLEVKPIALWQEAPGPEGVLVTNPPYGQRISVPDMEGLYSTIGNKLKNVFKGYHAWIISSTDEYFANIGLAPSQKVELLNGSIECQLREYIIFEGDKRSFLASGGRLKPRRDEAADEEYDDDVRMRHPNDRKRKFEDRSSRGPRRQRDDDRGPRKFRDNDDRGPRKFRDNDDRGPRKFRDSDDRGPRKFRDSDRRRDDRGKRRDNEDFDSAKRSGRGRPSTQSQQQEPSENPLAIRRNPDALKSITGKKPQLPPPPMRSRGWRKKDSDEN